MEARNRNLSDWFVRIKSGQVLLPRFQRHEAWGHKEVSSLLESVLDGLPTGALLVLEVGDEEPFVARPLVGAPQPTERVNEHLLDGQQRLTALWRSLHDDYDDRVYLIDVNGDQDADDESTVVRSESIRHKNEQRYPLWLDEPEECFRRGLIPLRLCRPEAPSDEIRGWAESAAGSDGDAWDIGGQINQYRAVVKDFKLPFLGLPVTTKKEIALDVFIKMNTSSVKLSAFDIVVAQYEAKTGDSLHDQLSGLNAAAPRLSAYRNVENAMLDIASLRSDWPPTQASYHRLDLGDLSGDFDEIAEGARFAVSILEQEAVFDAARLPTVAVVPVLGALAPHLPTKGDALGNAMTIVRSYLWRAFTTSRYESSAGTRALQDLRGLIEAVGGGDNTAPIFDEEFFPIPVASDLLRTGWPKNRQTLARAIMCASLRRGGIDFADSARATKENVGQREYHHLFPDSYLKKQAGLRKREIYRALNCSLITWTTNRKIAAKAPLSYLTERVEGSHLGEQEIRHRLESHLIPWEEFIATDLPVADAYDRFLEARAELVAPYLSDLCHGLDPARG